MAVLHSDPGGRWAMVGRAGRNIATFFANPVPDKKYYFINMLPVVNHSGGAAGRQ
jgi:hypothetical protein